MANPLQVGIIGASATSGWARDSHVPAVHRLAGLELGAVVSGSQEKSDAARNAFGARAAYADAQDLFRDPAIDIVSVCVKVPDHRELVLGALAAGKHVYCEWPLGRDLAETEALASAAQAAANAAGVRVALGLQTRLNPTAQRARDLLAAGAIGRPLSARVLSTTAAFGPMVEQAMAFGEDPANGVTLLSIQGAHTLDLSIALLGPMADLTALLTTQFPNIQVGQPPSPQTRTIPDHVLTQSHMANRSALSVEVAGGRPPETVTFRFEVTGDQGSLTLTGGAIRGFQSGRLELSLHGQPQQVDQGELASMPDAAANVAGVYAALRNDILSGSRTAPDFEHAVRLTRLVDDVTSSSCTATRMQPSGWPEL